MVSLRAPRPAAFLDRDGVINRSLVTDGRPVAPLAPADFEILPGVAPALARLRSAGFLNVVVTNQPDLATGRQTPAGLAAMHDRMQAALPIDAVRVCGHVDADGCRCRKPAPGMIVDAGRDLGIDLAASVLVGDRWRDIAAGQAAGCRCFFIDYGYAEPRPEPPFITVASLAAAVDVLLGPASPVRS